MGSEFRNIYSCFRTGCVLHFITVKPDPAKLNNTDQFKKWLTYLRTKKIEYWFREVKSPSGFLHFHGLIAYPSMEGDYHKMQKMRASIQRWVNRNIGLYNPLPTEGKIDNIILYICNETHNVPQREAFSNSVLLIEPTD